MRQQVPFLLFAVSFFVLVIAALVMALRDFSGDTAVAPAVDAATEEVVVTAVPLPTHPPANQLTNQPPTTQPTASHLVQPGETAFGIAAAYNLTVEQLAAANNLTDPTVLFAGQLLTIPGGQPTPEQPTNEPTTQPTSQPTSQPAIQPANPLPTTLNGLPLSTILVLPPNVMDNCRAIYAAGQALGRNAHAFAKVGDSTIENDHFLTRFDGGPYNLGDYAALQGVIDYFSGSFARDSTAVRIGLHSWTVFDPTWADKAVCQPNESVIACEFRLHNPAIVLIRLGSNDVGVPAMYDENMRQIVQYALDNGVIPVLGAKADRHEGSNQNNDILRQIAADYQIPLWDFDIVAGTLPGRGLDVDGVHMNTFYAHDYTQPEAFQRGHAMHNLTALLMLDAILNQVILPAAP